ncbi:MAG: glycosyl hydrolase [Thermoanaerobaculia bacterium]|nr:glycosyl hydrolase [Thermoanaerobaculia bacterium]
MKKLETLLLLLALLMSASSVEAKKEEAGEEEAPEAHLSSGNLSGLALRNIGPAINSGRVIDFAVTPGKRHRYFAATASGGLWKTDNAGTTWIPVFDGEGSYSIGDVTLDPNNPNVVWVGTGENNAQRSVSFGDGVYKSLDGGQSWTNVGLEESGHIGNIVIDPRDSNVVYVAAQGPLWNAGGDRGLYKTTDGGETWERILHISDDTGVAEVHLDPRDPDTIYATSWQRRRHVWTLLNGGPESAFHKSTDGGATWRQIDNGLPGVDRGRMGLCISPVEPDVIYGILDAVRDEGGTFRSTDRGESWEKRSSYTASGDYWGELFCDPHDLDTVYSVNVLLWVTKDGGKSFDSVPGKHRHVDDHALWIDPDDPDYLLVGCDGGVYESFDRGAHWLFKENLPITQFYRVSVDTSEPFYYVYGGTQDNNTLGGPSRTLGSAGITNEDWFITVGGDGYETRVDPTDPNIVYSQWQYGGLVRYDRLSKEVVDIQPQEEPGEPAHRWNWDSPLIISPHSHTRLYYASQRLFRSDDRGDNWTAISGDLSRQLDRDQLEIMGRLWEMDAVHKNKSTSDYGNIVSLDESPLVEGLLYVGTDDGLIQVTEDGGQNWRQVDRVPGIPERTYVSDLQASLHDQDTVYATFDNHKMGDFKPYIAVSRDRGQSWSSVSGDLPEREVVYTVIQDHVKPEILFAGTEFGLYVTLDEGRHWHGLKGGFPTIQVRDLDIQRSWNDLAVATFGRGFYILDDYTPLREMSEERLANESAILFPTRPAKLYIEQPDRIGSRGHGFYHAENPPFGAVFSYWLRDGLETKRELRIKAEKEARKAETDPPIPSMAELRSEDLEVEPRLYLTIHDADGALVRRVKAKRKKGLHRLAWDLRWPAAAPTDLRGPGELMPWERPERGPLVLPGSYKATLETVVGDQLETIAGPVDFEVESLDLAVLSAQDKVAVAAFQTQVRELRRAVLGASELTAEVQARIDHLRQALADTPSADPALMSQVERLEARLDERKLALHGDRTKASRNVFTPPSISARIGRISSDQWYTTQAPTGTHRKAYDWAADAFAGELEALRQLIADLEALEAEAEAAGAPWTPGRFPIWDH